MGALQAAQRGIAHSKLDDAMFWVGALFAFTPVVVALCVFGYVYWSRRKRRNDTSSEVSDGKA